tara:strand:- start:117 stop:281 length:165 start_codon:yes stop_codon:yes gene_type:complete
MKYLSGSKVSITITKAFKENLSWTKIAIKLLQVSKEFISQLRALITKVETMHPE